MNIWFKCIHDDLSINNIDNNISLRKNTETLLIRCLAYVVHHYSALLDFLKRNIFGVLHLVSTERKRRPYIFSFTYFIYIIWN